MGRPLKLEEVRQFDYMSVDFSQATSNTVMSWGGKTYVISCARCGRYTEDLSKDFFGQPIHEIPEDDSEPICMTCLKENFAAAFRHDTLQVVEETLGLGETDRHAIKAFIETIFTDPAKILQVKDMDNRVRELEKQNTRLWAALGIAFGLVAISIAGVVAIALALAA